jgi:hypothetical protein
MLVRLPFFLILSALVCGCVSDPSGGQPPTYVETGLTDSPIPRGSMVAMPDLPEALKLASELSTLIC